MTVETIVREETIVTVETIVAIDTTVTVETIVTVVNFDSRDYCVYSDYRDSRHYSRL